MLPRTVWNLRTQVIPSHHLPVAWIIGAYHRAQLFFEASQYWDYRHTPPRTAIFLETRFHYVATGCLQLTHSGDPILSLPVAP